MYHFKMIFTLLILSFLFQGCAEKDVWRLQWSDEFNEAGALNSEFWEYETGFIRNRELQYYTDSEKNVRIEDGHLIINALVEEGDSITSASVNTFGKLDFLYGKIEVRAKIPSALGTWPAIWMLGIDKKELGWPACGEIDIMEHVGYDPDVVHANIHTKAYNHMINTNKGNRINVKDPWADFHVYSVEWFEDHMDFFLDDSLYFSYENDMVGNHDTWPFDKPHYLLINLAFGGSWGGTEGVDPSALPVQYEIDYVRYYKHKD